MALLHSDTQCTARHDVASSVRCAGSTARVMASFATSRVSVFSFIFVLERVARFDGKGHTATYGGLSQSLEVLDDFCCRRLASSIIECLMPCGSGRSRAVRDVRLLRTVNKSSVHVKVCAPHSRWRCCGSCIVAVERSCTCGMLLIRARARIHCMTPQGQAEGWRGANHIRGNLNDESTEHSFVAKKLHT